jgi:hypothetical protein
MPPATGEALTATMLLASPASAQRGCREVCIDGNCRITARSGATTEIGITTATARTGAICTCTPAGTGITTEIGITTATADPEYTFMHLESAASNSATKYSSGTVHAPSVTKNSRRFRLARGDRPRIFSSGAAGLWLSAAIFLSETDPV